MPSSKVSVPDPAAGGALPPPAQKPIRTQSLLGKLLVSLFCWGWISLPFVQRIAMAAVRDIEYAKAYDYNFVDLEFLAQLGNDGEQPGNMYRQWSNHINTTGWHKPTEVSVPMQVKPQQVKNVKQHILFPHVVFADLYRNDPAAFEARVAPGEEVLEQWWADMQGHPLMRDTPFAGRQNYRCHTLNTTIHIKSNTGFT